MAEPIEKKVQNVVVGIDNIGPKFIGVLVWLAVAVILFFMAFSVQTTYPIRIDQIDAMDYAQIARNIQQGEGFTTKFIRPLSLRYFPYFEKHPEVTNPPLYSLYLSLIMNMINEQTAVPGESDGKIIIFGSGIFFILSIPLFFWLASRYMKDKMLHIALFLFTANSIMIKQSITALPDMMLVSLFLLFMIVMSYYDGENIFTPAVAGAILGLCYLTRYSYGLFAPVVLVFFYFRAKRYKIMHMLMFLVTFLAVISPWLLRNYRLIGNPFFTLEFFKYKMFTDLLPGNQYWRSAIDKRFEIGFDFVFFVRKLGIGLRQNYDKLLTITGSIVGCFFVVGLFWGGLKSRFERLKWLFVILFFLQLILSALFRPGANVLLPFFPVIILVAVNLFHDIIDKKSIDPFMRLGIVTLFVLAAFFPVMWGFVPKVFKDVKYRETKPYWEENMIEVSQMVKPNTTVVSDIPWATAWYGGLISIWLPWGEEDYEYIESAARPADGCYFSPMVLRYPQDEDKIWLKFYSYIVRYNQAPEGNKFGWTWANRFRQGDVVCLDSDVMVVK